MDLGELFVKKEVMMVLTCSVSDKEVRMRKCFEATEDWMAERSNGV